MFGRRAVALVYRGPASLPGCPEAVGAVLRAAGLRPQFVGPRERLQPDAATLAGAAVYAQPGGADLQTAWPHLQAHAQDIRAYVRSGGCYLGFCLGGYLAGRGPGLELLPGDTGQYITSRQSSVTHDGDAVVAVQWRGQMRVVYFQDGPYFDLRGQAPAEVLARYDNQLPAAAVCRYGTGRVGVVGPHPEATADWFTDAGFPAPTTLAADLAVDLISTTLGR